MVEMNIGKNFKITKKLGSGAFGEIYQAINVKNNLEVAIKLEPTNTKSPQLFYETNIYKYLLQDNSVFDKGIPQVYYCSNKGEYNIMVMDLLGKSLEDLFNLCSRKFSLKTVIMVAIQLLQRIEYVHLRTFLHRDIKPDNFLTGTGKRSNKIFIIDFGLAKRYIQKDGSHIPYKDNKNLTGTARYASLNTHLGIEQARRDDLESMGYVCMYFLRGSLPWQNMKAKNRKEKYEKIKEKKIDTTVDTLCKGYPSEFTTYLKYCKGLRFEEKPDYEYLKTLFKELMKKMNYEYDNNFDWIPLEKLNEVKEKFKEKEEKKDEKKELEKKEDDKREELMKKK